RRLRPEVSKNSSTALSSNERELARSITTCVPAMASLRPSPVMLLTPVFGEAATTSWPRWRRMGTVFEPIRPVPPITTIFIPNLLEEDEVEGEPPRHGADDLFEEAHEVRAAVRPRYGAQHLAGRHIEGGVEAGGAVAGVIVRPSRDLLVTEGGRGSRRRSERIPPLWALSSEVGGDGGGNPTLTRPPAGNTPDLAGPGGW